MHPCRRMLVTLLSGILSMAAADVVYGQDRCGAVIVPTQINQDADFQVKLAYLKTIQSEEDLERARSAGGGGSYGGFSLSGSYEEFDRRRNSYLNDLNFNLDVNESRKLVVSFLPQSVTHDWLECIKRTSHGITLYAEDVTKDAVTLVAFWNPPPGVSTAVLAAQVRGASINDQQLTTALRTEWTTEGSQPVILDRDPKLELRIAVTIGGFSDHFVVPPHRDSPPPPNPEPIQFGACDPSPYTFSSFVNLRCGFNFGQVLRNATDDPRENVVEYSVQATAPGDYRLGIRYSNLEPTRTVRVLINGEEYFSHALGQTNGGCWSDSCVPQEFTELGTVYLRAGENRIRIENRKDSNGNWIPLPHLYAFRLKPV